MPEDPALGDHCISGGEARGGCHLTGSGLCLCSRPLSELLVRIISNGASCSNTSSSSRRRKSDVMKEITSGKIAKDGDKYRKGNQDDVKFRSCRLIPAYSIYALQDDASSDMHG